MGVVTYVNAFAKHTETLAVVATVKIFTTHPKS